MDGITPNGHRRGPAPHRGALSALIVFYTMGLAAMAFLLGVKTIPMARLALASKSRPAGRSRVQARPERRLARLPASLNRPITQRRRPARVRRATAPTAERLRRSASTARHRATRIRTARRSPAAQTKLQMARRPAEQRRQMRIVFLPRRTPDIAWVNPPPADWPKECRPPEPGSRRRF
jgi:hypothetical protein